MLPVVVGSVLGLVPIAMYYLKAIPLGHTLFWTFPWYIGLFAMGMAAASIGFSNRRAENELRDSFNWPVFSIVSLVLCGLVRMKIGSLLVPEIWICDLLIGISASCFIIACANNVLKRRNALPDWVISILSCKPVQKLGSFSYSLYLIHVPVLWSLSTMDRKLHLDAVDKPLITTLVHLIVGPTLALTVGYGFHLLFEKPFQRKSS